MALKTACPNCRTSYQLADDALGRKVRCKKCQQSFLAQAVPTETGIRAKQSAAIATSPRPAQPRSAPPRPAAPPVAPPPPPQYGSYEVVEDEPNFPPMRRPQKQKSSAMPWIIGGSIAGAVLLVGVIVLIIVLANRDSDPPIAEFPANIPNDFNMPVHQGQPPPPRPFFPNNPPPVKPLAPVKPAGLIAEPSTRLLVEAKHHVVKDVVFASQSDIVGYLYWNTAGNFEKMFELWDWRQAKKLGAVNIGGDQTLLNLSPKGTRLVGVDNRNINIWSLPEGNPLFAKWDPYPPQPGKGFSRESTTWAVMIDEERLLTVASSGRFDLWDMNGKRQLYSIPAKRQGVTMGLNYFGRCPSNMALSRDGKTLALANGDGFDLFETEGGKQLGKTETFALRGRVGNMWAVQFNRDATQLAFKGNLHVTGKQQEIIAVFDVATGANKVEFPLSQDFSRNGALVWLGADHILTLDGNNISGGLFSLKSGRYERNCQHEGSGNRFIRQGPDERIWYVGSSVFDAPAQLLAIDPPAADLARQPAAAAGNPPQWRFSAHGIVFMMQ